MAVGDATKVLIVIKAITIKIKYPVGLQPSNELFAHLL